MNNIKIIILDYFREYIKYKLKHPTQQAFAYSQ